jgi:hypothetical protein
VKTALIVLAIIVAVIVVAFAIMSFIGSRLPLGHTATRSMRVQRSPAVVYAAVRDFQSFPKWRRDVKRVEILGAAQFREHASHGAVTYDVVEDIPAQKLVTRIADKDLGYTGSWTYELRPDGDGTILTITEKGEIANPMFRFLSHYVFGQTATMEKYLEDLAKHS